MDNLRIVQKSSNPESEGTSATVPKLLLLPAELRTQIWEYVVSRELTVIVCECLERQSKRSLTRCWEHKTRQTPCKEHPFSRPTVPLYLVSKQFMNEVHPYLLSTAYAFNSHECAKQWLLVLTRNQRRIVKRIEFHVTGFYCKMWALRKMKTQEDKDGLPKQYEGMVLHELEDHIRRSLQEIVTEIEVHSAQLLMEKSKYPVIHVPVDLLDVASDPKLAKRAPMENWGKNPRNALNKIS